MKKSEILMAKHDKHSAYYDAKKERYSQMEKDSRSLKRLGRLMDLNGMLMELSALINDALLGELVESENNNSNGGMNMSEQEFQKDLIETIIKFMFMLSKQDDEKRKETIEFFEKESGTKLMGEYK